MFKRFTFLPVQLLIYCFTFAQVKNEIKPNGYNIFYYDNGIKSSEGMMKDGKPDGYWKTYYADGKLKSEGNRRNFELDSTWKFYDNTGRLSMEINYVNGKKNGIRKTFEDGKLVSIESFRDDMRHGDFLSYYPVKENEEYGAIHKKINYINGKEEGKAFEFSKDSLIITIWNYKNGISLKTEMINRRDRFGRKYGEWREFYKNGTIKSEGNYRDNKKHGVFRYYFENGTLKGTFTYEEGELIKDADPITDMETVKEYYPGAKIKTTGTLKKGKPEGVFREFDESGEITASKIFREGSKIAESVKGIIDKNGLKQGLWKEYYPEGALKSEGEYKNNVREGEWVFYFENGNIEQKGTYFKGKPDGLWKWFYPGGLILREEEFSSGTEHGFLREYSDSGRIITSGKYEFGEKEGRWIYEMGTHREEGNYKSGLRDSVWIYFYPNGKKCFEGMFILGEPEGKHATWYPNGKIKEEGEYLAGRKEGPWKRYNADESVFITTGFKDGVEIKFDGTKIKPETTEAQ
ncbi:MAG: toxin-antitoxin system YwqK family antitoxin [Bacteroidetes bacterium]|nr:toxin-antitoxin system YwqK family antitoxin [Bacteroidota bacterium]